MPLTTLYDGKGKDGKLGPELDIVAVHGLNPFNKSDHGWNTWRSPPSNDGYLWLRDSLPKTLPTARVMMYTYNSSPVFGSGKGRFIGEASQLLETLFVKRNEDPARPLMLIGHSLGGILIKQALVNAQANRKHKGIIDATFGLVFIGTPHGGSTKSSKIAFGKACVKIIQTVYGHASNDLMKAVEHGSLFSDVLKENWRHQLENYQIVSCYESIDEVVPYDSAVLGLPGHRETILRRQSDHRNAARFNPCNKEDQEDLEILEGNMAALCATVLGSGIVEAAPVPDFLKDEVFGSFERFGSNPRYANIELQHPNTLRWIAGRKVAGGPGLIDWLQNNEGLFFISGKPGSGKSTLMKFIHNLDSPLRYISSEGTNLAVQISFFFYDQGLPSERSFLGLLHALLAQLIDQIPELLPIILPRYNILKTRSGRHLGDTSMWSESELQAAFTDIVEAQPFVARVLCLVDGLDECEPGSVRQAVQFLLYLASFPISARFGFKVLCSSRPENPIELTLTKFPTFKVQDYTTGDIQRYVVETFDSFSSNLYPEDETIALSREHIIPEIVHKAEGVFIWARLVVTELILSIEAGDVDNLEGKLNQLPSDLEHLYSRIVSKIPPGLRHDTFNYLQLFVYDRNMKGSPINLLGMTIAVKPLPDITTLQNEPGISTNTISACSQTKRLLQDRCRGFINLPTFNPTWDSQKLLDSFCLKPISIHKTVLDYLFAEDQAENSVVIAAKPTLDIYAQRAAFFFRLLSCDIVTQRQVISEGQSEPRPLGLVFDSLVCCLVSSEKRGDFPLAPMWLPAIEARLKIRIPQEEQLEDFLDSFMAHSYTFFERHAEDLAVSPWHTNFLAFAVWYGLYSFVDKAGNEDKEKCKKDGRPLLHYAIERNFMENRDLKMMKLLFSKGCRPEWEFNSRSTWEYFLVDLYARPSQWLNSEDDTCTLLFLEFGADPNQTFTLLEYQGLALHVMLSEHNLEYDRLGIVLREFLDKGANPDLRDSDGQSGLDMAKRNWPQAVPLLLSRTTAAAATTTATTEPVVNEASEESKPKPIRESSTSCVSLLKEWLLESVELQEELYGYERRRPLRIV